MTEGEVFAIAKTVLSQSIDLDTLLAQYKALKETKMETMQTKKLLAELSFLIAKEYLKIGNQAEAARYAEESLDFYGDIKIETLDDSVPILSKILPEKMHEGIVKDSLLNLLTRKA